MHTERDLLHQAASQAHTAGWNNVLTEQSFRSADVIYQPDLVLGYNFYPLAVLETKSTAVAQLQEGLTRSLEYATNLGIPVALATNGTQGLQQIVNTTDISPIEHIPAPQQLWNALGRDWTPSDPRLSPPLSPGAPPPRLHQLLAIGNTLDSILTGSTRVGIAMAQGSGRHLVAVQILWKLLNSGYCRRALYLFENAAILEQTLHRISQTSEDVIAIRQSSDFLNPTRIHLCTMHRFLKQWEDQPDFFRPEWYDLILTQDARQTEHHLPKLNHFHQAIQIAFAHKATTPLFKTVFQYTLEDALTAEQAEPPPGFRSVRLGDIADLRTGINSLALRVSPNTSLKKDLALIAARDISEGTVDFTQAKSIVAPLSEDLRLKTGDILISSLFALSKPRIALLREAPNSPATHAHSIIRIRVDPQQARPEDV